MIDTQIDTILSQVNNIKDLLTAIQKRPDIIKYDYDKLKIKMNSLAQNDKIIDEVIFDLFDAPCKGSYQCIHEYVNTYLRTHSAQYTHFELDDDYYIKLMCVIDKSTYQDIHSSLPKTMEFEFDKKYGLIIQAILDVYYSSITNNDDTTSEFIISLFTDNISFFNLLAMVGNTEWENSFINDNIPSSQRSIAESIFSYLKNIYSIPEVHENFYVELLSLHQREPRNVYDVIARYEEYIGDTTFEIGMGYIMILKTEKSDSMLKYISTFISEVVLKLENVNSTILAGFFKDLTEIIEFTSMSKLKPEIYNTIEKYVIKQNNLYTVATNPTNNAYYVSESLNEIKYSFRTENYFENALEAYKKNSTVVHDTQHKIFKAYKAYKDEESKIDSQLSKAILAMKKVATGDVRTQIIEGKEFSAIGLLKKVLGTVALFNVSKIALIIGIVVRYASKKTTTDSERRKIVMELKQELEMIEEKIDDAKGDGNRKAKYEMMRTRSELKSAIERIQYGIDASKGSMKTARNVLSQSRNTTA